MLDLTITKEQFEHILPVFQSPTEHLFERLAHEIKVATDTIHGLVGDYADENENIDGIVDYAKTYICATAARRTIPQLDLVLTETGFGVVSNQHVVPASQARVTALDESLRQKASMAWDHLLLMLLHTPWRESDSAIARVAGLYWLPTHCRRYGVTANDKIVYDDEFCSLHPSLAMAEGKVAAMISPELYDYLVEQERTNHGGMSTATSLLLERSRNVVAALMKEKTYPRAVQSLTKRMMETIEQYKEEFPQYTGSSTYKAKALTYENKKEDTTFFFS